MSSYQKFTGYSKVMNVNGVVLNNHDLMRQMMSDDDLAEMYLYTQHQIVWDGEELQQTRSSPNWDGGMVSYATCKHNMRTYSRDTWNGVWIGGLCPKECANNTLLFVGRIDQEFESNYDYSQWLRENKNMVWQEKRAGNNRRGDCYMPKTLLKDGERYVHSNFIEPKNHTRSVEFYDKSPGSVSPFSDGKIPKWWRDIEYLQHGRRPHTFIFNPCFIFSKPLVWSRLKPGRATLRISTNSFVESLIWD